MDVDGELMGGGCECMWWVVNEVVVGYMVIQRWLHTHKLLVTVYINQ